MFINYFNFGGKMKAFPQRYPIDANKEHHAQENPLDRGMDLKDYFAAKAMQVIKCSDYKTTAEHCYLLADAMMEARKK
jgi:hypothetical protein